MAPAVAQGGTSGSYGSNVKTDQPYHNQVQSVFGNANLSWKDMIFLTLSARNDWSSNLAFTPDDHYFYPSAGLNFIAGGQYRHPIPDQSGQYHVGQQYGPQHYSAVQPQA